MYSKAEGRQQKPKFCEGNRRMGKLNRQSQRTHSVDVPVSLPRSENITTLTKVGIFSVKNYTVAICRA